MFTTMTSLLIHRANCIATQNDSNTELRDASILIEDGVIKKIFTASGDVNQLQQLSQLLQSVDEVIDASKHVVIPGMVNTHHHMVQSLTRAVPSVQS